MFRDIKLCKQWTKLIKWQFWLIWGYQAQNLHSLDPPCQLTVFKQILNYWGLLNPTLHILSCILRYSFNHRHSQCEYTFNSQDSF